MVVTRISFGRRLRRGLARGRSLFVKPVFLLAGLSVVGGTACYGPPPVGLPTQEQVQALTEQSATSQPASPGASEDAAQGMPDGEPADAS